MPTTIDDLRRYAVARSLFAPTTLRRALLKLGFVQADPIRAPARAQDLTLRHRVKDYRAGDLERLYSKLAIEEDFFVNYGFITDALHALMHPRLAALPKPGEQYRDPAVTPRWSPQRRKQAALLLEFVRERGVVHPREAEDHFEHGTVRNWFGGSTNATTQMLDAMHYSGLLRVVRRDGGTRVYAIRERRLGPSNADERRARVDALVDAVINIYAPLPASSLWFLVSRIRHGAPQWYGELKAALLRAKERMSTAHVDGTDWYWPSAENPKRFVPTETVRLLTPFDPVVWDRDRFELLWGWTYRFEAYTPPAKRKMGYYALPMLWRDRVIGWGNVAVKDGEMISDFGYVRAQPRDRAFKRELAAELDRMRAFLAITP
jgi:uncharacterized protein YcaQ